MSSLDETIEEQAVRWVLRLDAGPLDSSEQQPLEEWLAADSRHRGAFVKARAQWSDLDRLASLAAGISTGELPVSTTPCQQVGAWAVNRRTVLAAGLAGVSAAGLGAFALFSRGERYRTAIGELRRIALADGSMLVLNTDSEARVEYSDEKRKVILTRGEALLEVARDADRPFLVRAQDVRVRAVGTMFAVRLRDGEVDVTVSEGVVEVERGSAPDAAPRRIAANQQSVVPVAAPAAAVQVEPLAPDIVERRFAWVNGMVAFDGESLADAVAEVNRHSRRRIVIDDPRLAVQPIVGVFRATDAEGFCNTAAAALGASVEERSETIHLYY